MCWHINSLDVLCIWCHPMDAVVLVNELSHWISFTEIVELQEIRINFKKYHSNMYQLQKYVSTSKKRLRNLIFGGSGAFYPNRQPRRHVCLMLGWTLHQKDQNDRATQQALSCPCAISVPGDGRIAPCRGLQSPMCHHVSYSQAWVSPRARKTPNPLSPVRIQRRRRKLAPGCSTPKPSISCKMCD